jgi:hypothetical protein
MIAIKISQYMQEVRVMQDQIAGTAGGGPDPLVALKEKEIEQRAAADQAKMKFNEQKLQLEQQKLQQSTQIDRERLQLQAARQGG